MKIELHKIPIKEVVKEYKDSAEEGVTAYSGKLDIRPKYQREFVYKEKQRNEVIETVRKYFPLNIMYWVKKPDGNFEVLDGQQRTISIAQYVAGEFSINEKYFHSLTKDEQNQILNYELMIYFCEGKEREKLNWFRIVNISGEKLTEQELRNSVYTGTWLSDAKLKFSKTNCAAYLLASDGGQLVTGSPIRQEFLETVLSWINKGKIEEYMSKHQHDKNANELWGYFQKVIEWVRKTFPNYRTEMKGLEWGRLYEEYHNKRYNPQKISATVHRLYADPYVRNKRGVFEYILGGEKDTKLLDVRVFDEATKKTVYTIQTDKSKKEEKSNCPLCAIGHSANKKKIWKIDEMDADHVSSWSKGGKTDIKNCQMLCKTHNRAKGNK